MQLRLDDNRLVHLAKLDPSGGSLWNVQRSVPENILKMSAKKSPAKTSIKAPTKAPAKKTTATATAKDLKPKKNAKGGVLIGLLLPAVQKVR